MTIPIRIRRSTGSTAPSSLRNAELAYAEGGGGTLFIGVGVGGAGGSATTVQPIAGMAAVLGLGSVTQTAVGTYTFSGTVSFTGTTGLGAATATSPSVNDDSTRVATTEWVKDQGFLTSASNGTVTSVGLSLPNIFSVTGSPITTTGTLTATLAVQAANRIFAGPSAGGDAAPTFRALVAADIPDLSATYLALSGTQTASGTFTWTGSNTFTGTTALGAATATTPSANDDSTKVATTEWVVDKAYLTGNQSITLSGDASGTGATSIVVTLANNSVTNSKLADMESSRIKGRATAGSGDPEDLTADQVKTLLAIAHTNITDFDTGVRQNRLDEMAAPTGSVSMNSQKLTNLAAPTSDNDAATKAYVDAAKSGLDVKDSVRVATTANLASLSGLLTIDGITVVAGDRVLVKNQSTKSGNGIYLAASGAWSRATDADSSAEVSAGMFTFVEEGTTNADSGWVCTTDGSITVGTTEIEFAQFSGAGQVIAGDGLGKSGNTLSVNVDNSTLEISSDSLRIKDSGVTNAKIAANTIDLATKVTGTLPVANGGTGLSAAAKGSVVVANTANTLSALDGGGSANGVLLYTASSDTIAWATELDGGTF